MAWPAIAAAAIGAGSDLTGGFLTNYQNNKNRHWQEDMTNIARMWSLQDQQSERDFQRSMAEYNNEFNASEAEKSYRRQLELQKQNAYYNSPGYMMSQARNAGLNPSVFMGGSVTPAGSTPSASQASAGGSGVSSQIPNLFSPNPAGQFPLVAGQGFSAGVKNIAEALQAISQAKKTGVETTQLETMLSKYALAEDLKNDLMAENLKLVKAFGSQEKASKIIESYAHAAQLIAQGDRDKAEEALSQAKRDTERELTGLNKAKREEAEKVAARTDELLTAQIRNYNTSSEKNRSEAKLNIALYQTEEQLREGRKNLLSSDRSVRDAEKKKLIAEYDTIMNNLRKAGIVNPWDVDKYRKAFDHQLELAIEKQEFENTWLGRFMGALSAGSAGAAGALIMALPK